MTWMPWWYDHKPRARHPGVWSQVGLSITTNKSSVMMEFQLSYCKALKMMLLKCYTQYASKFRKLNSGHMTRKGQFHSNAKECSSYHTILISYASKVVFKILQARFQQCVNRDFPDVQAAFRKGRGTTDQITNICWTTEKGNSRKPSTSASLTVLKPLTV